MRNLFLTAIFLLKMINVYSSAVVNASISAPYPNSIYNYFAPSKTMVTLTLNSYFDNNIVKVFITNNTTGATLKNNTGITISSNFSNPVQTLNYTQLSNLLNPASLTITGFSGPELTAFNNNGTLPDGNYTFCFEYWASSSVATPTNQTDVTSNNCPAGINISASAQTVNVNTSVSFNMFNRKFSQLSAPGVVNTIITSNVNDHFGVTWAIILTGSNGLVISSKSTKCSTALRFNLGPSSSVAHSASSSEISDAFDLSGLNVTGPANLVNAFNSNNFLPDGNYTLCFRGQANCNNISDPTLGCASFAVAIDPISITAPLTQTQTVDHKFDNIKNLVPSFMLMSKSDYPSNLSAKLRVTGDNGVFLLSEPTFSLPAIAANTPVNLSFTDIAQFFISANIVNATGINLTQFRTDGILPDGNYTLCYEIYDVDRITKVSGPATGCYQLKLFTDPVHVMTIAPPFTERDFDNIGSKISAVTLTTQSNYSNVKVGLKLTGTNGVNIRTNLSSSPVIFTGISANVPIVLNSAQIASLFNKATLTVSGLSTQQFMADGRLPDGTYTICFEVYNSSNVLVSDPLTSTCAIPFTLSSVTPGLSLNEPPMIIMPQCGVNIKQTNPQNIIFSWLMPSSLNMMKKLPNQDYILRIVEINNPNSNPYDAFRSATTPRFFEKTVTGNSYIFGPADPHLEPGKKYAFSVQVAKDYSDFRNNGQSDICSFIYDADTTRPVFILKKIDKEKNKIKIVNNSASITAQLKFTHGGLKYLNQAAETELYEDHLADENKPYPLKNQSVRLISAVSVLPVYKTKIKVPEIIKKDTIWKWVSVDSLSVVNRQPSTDPMVIEAETKLNSLAAKNLNKTVAVGTTDANGFVTFNIATSNPFPVIIDTLMPPGFAQQMAMYKMLADTLGVPWPYGNVDHWVIARGYAMDIANPMYTDPKILFAPVKSQLLNAGEVITNVSSYRLSVELEDKLKLENDSKNKWKNVITSGPATVYVMKKKTSVNYPEYEGNPLKKGTLTLKMEKQSGNGSTYMVDENFTILDKMDIPYNETAHFLRLYYSLTQDDKYYIYVTYDKGNTFYEAKPFSKAVGRSWNTYNSDPADIVGHQSMQVSPDLIDGAMKGHMTYSFYDFNSKNRLAPRQMQKNIKLKLVRMSVAWDSKNNKNTYTDIREVDVTTTDQNGDFTFKTGKLKYNDYLTTTGSGSFYDHLYVVVDNAYYLSPKNSVYFDQKKTISDVGTLEAYVRQGEYASRIIARSPGAKSNDKTEANYPPRSGDKVFMCRKKGVKINGLPEDEGSVNKSSLSKHVIKDPDGNEYIVLDETTAGDKGQYKFSRIVYRDANNVNDKFYIFSEVPFGSYDNYRTPYPIWINFQQSKWGQYKLASDFKAETYGMCYNSTYGWCGEESEAQEPYIVGAVYPVTNPTQTLEGVKIEMFNMGAMKLEAGKKYVNENKAVAEYVQYTADNGKFEFRDFNKGWFNGWRILRFTKKGFIPKIVVVNNGEVLKKGQRESLDKVYLELPIITYCYVTNEEDKDVAGKIIVGENFSWAATGYVYEPQPGNAARLECPSGKVQFIFIPNNTDEYNIDTFTQNISFFTKSFTHKAKKARHRIVLSLKDKTTKKSLSFTATITNLNFPEEYKSVKFLFGTEIVFMEFQSAGTEFDIRIVPDNLHEIVNITVNSIPGPANQYVDVESAQARIVSGLVSVEVEFGMPGKPKNKITKPLSGAMVYFQGLENSVGQATTGDDGKYVLGHVPINIIYALTAAKEGPYIGQTKYLLTEMFPANRKLAGQNFTLSSFKGFDISTLYGFPLLVESLKDNGKSVLISGKVRLIPGANKPKKAYKEIKDIDAGGDEPMLAKVSNVLLKKENYDGSIDDLKKKFDPVTLNINTLPFVMYGKFIGTMESDKGLTLIATDSKGTTGALMGHASIDPASFTKGFSYKGNIFLNEKTKAIDVTDAIYTNSVKYTTTYNSADYSGYNFEKLKDYNPYKGYDNNSSPGIKASDMPIFTSSGKFPDDYSSGFNVSDAMANTIIYTLHNYEQVGTKSGSTFDKSGLHLNSVIHTDLLHVDETPDIKLSIGTVDINQDYAAQVNSSKEFTIKLGKWNIVGEKWSMGSGGLKISKGRLDAAGVTVPFSGMLIGQQEMSFAKFEFSQVKMLNNDKLKLNINQENTITGFGYDKGYGGSESNGAWSLSIIAKTGGYLSEIGGLPDLDPNDKIYISNINLYNTGDDKILLKENHPAVTIAGVTKFYPTAIWGTAYNIKFKGNISLDIPNLTGLSNISYELIYKTDKDKLVHVPSEKKIEGLQLKAKGIEIFFSKENQSLANNEARFYGTLSDVDPKSKYQFQVILIKKGGSNGSCEIIMNKEKKSDNVFKLDNSGGKLINLDGRMSVSGNQWNNFVFEGDIDGVDGVDDQHRHLKFVVKGDLVADNSNIGVKNMSAGGMSGLSLTYDFEKKGIVGSGHMDQMAPNGRFVGDIEMFMGAEWYFFASIKVINLSNCPISEFGAAMFIGNGGINSNMKTAMAGHFHENKLPDNLQAKVKHKGIMFAGGFDVPIPQVPTWDLNIGGIVKSSFHNGIYAGVYFTLEFTENAKLGIGGTVGAWVELGAGATIGIACFNINLKADAGVAIEGSIEKAGNFEIKLSVYLKLTGSAYVGGGVCNADCQTPCWETFLGDVCSPIPCVKTGMSGSETITLSGKLSNKGFELSFN